MGVDLTLLPYRDRGDGWVCARTVLPLERNSDLWEVIRELPSEPVPSEFWAYQAPRRPAGERMGKLRKDPYGDPLRSVSAADLGRLRNHPEVRRAGNQAAFRYIAALPADWRVALYWD
jgi:hypothetical protein